MNFSKKIITSLYLMTVYTFPFLVLFLIFTAIQLWSLTGQKEMIITGLSSSSEALRNIQNDMESLKQNLGQLKETAEDFRVSEIKTSGAIDDHGAIASGKNRKALLDLTPETVNRAKAMMRVGTDYSKAGYLVNQRANRYYAVVISYEDLAYALVQRQHLVSVGFGNSKILVLKGLYAVSIEDARSKSDKALLKAIEKWSSFPDNGKLPFLKKF